MIFYFDARPGFTSFLSLASAAEAQLTVRIDLRAADLRPSLTLEEVLAPGATRTLDVGALREAGLAPEPGLAVATAVDATGTPLTSRALAGTFSVANVELGSAWGGPGAARLARRAGDASLPPLGTPVDGATVLFEQIRPAALDLATFHDPAALANGGGNQVVFVSFDDVAGEAPALARAAMRWVLAARRNDGDEIATVAHDTSGVEVSHLERLLGPAVNGAGGRLELVARTPAAPNRLVFFSQSLGTFSVGHLLPPLP